MKDAPKNDDPARDSPLDGLTFCLDETNDGPHLIAFLRAKGANVERLKDHHVHCGTNDENWLPYVSAKRWIILSRDKNIRKRLLELLAIKNACGRMFVLRSHAISAPEIADIIDKCYPRMLRIIEETEAPFIAHIVRSGAITIVPLPDWSLPINANQTVAS